MFDFHTNPTHVSRRGMALLENPAYNKGTAFSEAERTAFQLRGLLPPHVDSLADQVARSYEEYQQKTEDLERHIFLRQLQDENETLFYRLLFENIEELTPMIYTPVVGLACQRFGHIFRRPRGIYIGYPNRDQMDTILQNVDHEVDVIVVTDGERILGLGDQGAGGMGIPIGKLSLYSLCGGIHPRRTLPVLLDLGTDNEKRLTDPRYQGWRRKRIRGREYDEFVECFVQAVMTRFPKVLLQWEDFASNNAQPILERYQNRLCTFNDDIQGTAGVILGTILSAMKAKKERLEDQVILSVGAGSAGFGAFELLLRAMQDRGLTEAQARARVFVTDSKGLLFEGREGITGMKAIMAQDASFAEWAGEDGFVSTEQVVQRAKPTVMIGATGRANTFTEALVRPMLDYTEHPVVMPLSNPTSRTEATPTQILQWTDGRALIATGSPFAPVEYNGVLHSIAQCNNIYVFPAMGLGICSVNARRVSKDMFLACAEALAKESPALNGLHNPLLPPLTQIREVSKRTALAIALTAQADGTADLVSEDEVALRIDCKMWEPEYQEYLAT